MTFKIIYVIIVPIKETKGVSEITYEGKEMNEMSNVVRDVLQGEYKDQEGNRVVIMAQATAFGISEIHVEKFTKRGRRLLDERAINWQNVPGTRVVGSDGGERLNALISSLPESAREDVAAHAKGFGQYVRGEKNKSEIGKYACDGGCLRLTVDGGTVRIHNGVGDGRFPLYMSDDFLVPRAFGFHEACQVDGCVSVFAYDYADKPALELSGVFSVYRLKGEMWLVKCK